jgi:flavin-dependent dehydrogenase
VRRTAALIVGGGPAGSAAAIALARGGAAPLLIERSREPHDVVCGGFLGWDALTGLGRLGIDPAALGAKPITRLRLFGSKRRVEAPLPHAAAGLSRRVLDEALLTEAGRAGTAIERGVTARRAEGLVLRLADGSSLAADALFLATGKHDLRGLSRPREASGEDPAVGLRARLTPSARLTRDLEGVIELHLFERGYAGLLLQEDGSANLCLSVAASRLANANGKAETLLAELAADAPALAERWGEAADTRKWLAVSGVPYGWRAVETTPGLFRLGDQAAVIASLAGDGVAIALGSGMIAAEHYLGHGTAGSAAYQRAFARQSRRPLAIAGALRSFGEDRRIAPPLLALLAHFPGLASMFARFTRIAGH